MKLWFLLISWLEEMVISLEVFPSVSHWMSGVEWMFVLLGITHGSFALWYVS